jgi:hypothetical protein
MAFPPGHEEGLRLSQSEQLAIDRGAAAVDQDAERAARGSLRAQVARLERELSQLVAGAFPYVSSLDTGEGAGTDLGEVHGWNGATPAPRFGVLPGPSLLSLEQLERQRDRLAHRIGHLHRRLEQRALHERRAHELLERMRRDPGSYKFVSLPVRDLGQGGCGVWEVRPRLGLIGMLAGWWQLKLSSGCPLARGSRPRRDPARS